MFHVWRGKRNSQCKECRNRTWSTKNKEENWAKQTRWYKRLRYDVLSYYSNGIPMCACCSEETFCFLSLDHIHEDGATHRRNLKGKTCKIYSWVRLNNYPPGFQVLCHNCNIAKHHLGVCPHQLTGDARYLSHETEKESYERTVDTN